MDSANEQHEITSGRNNSERADLQLSTTGAQISLFPTEEEQIEYIDRTEDSRKSFVFSSANLDDTDADLQDALVVDGGLLSNEDKAVISEWFRRGDENLQVAKNLSANFVEHNDTFFLVTDEKADYYSFADGVIVNVLDKNDDVSYSVSA